MFDFRKVLPGTPARALRSGRQQTTFWAWNLLLFGPAKVARDYARRRCFAIFSRGAGADVSRVPRTSDPAQMGIVAYQPVTHRLGASYDIEVIKTVPMAATVGLCQP